ncbi:hypothetical protein [Pseudorhodoplanes sp.]|uniref:hypothetical protein n=1 Tax=Pseudorhodoplanes sp. TaxID=1934341 RepID=UPI003D0D5F77
MWPQAGERVGGALPWLLRIAMLHVAAFISALTVSVAPGKAASACELVKDYLTGPPRQFIANRRGQPDKNGFWAASNKLETHGCVLASGEITANEFNYQLICHWTEDRKLFNSSLRELRSCVPKLLLSPTLKIGSEITSEAHKHSWELDTDAENQIVELIWEYGSYLLSIGYWPKK